MHDDGDVCVAMLQVKTGILRWGLCAGSSTEQWFSCHQGRH